MKKILITGKNSYIGTSVENWLKASNDDYDITSIDMKNGSWKQHDFSKYDVVLHVAGIAHVSTNHSLDDLYYSVNRDLAIATAHKAQASGVKQFIFMSSGILYGIDEPIGTEVMIDRNYTPHPFTAYGKSKLQADTEIANLNSDTFKTVCIRTPMVYGKGCKGNFQLLRKYANKLVILPQINNCRSMIHIENLANFIKIRIDNGDGGIFWPQNAEYISTNQIVKEIRRIHGKKTRYSVILADIVKLASKFIPKFRKIYGNLAYDRSLSTSEYIVNDFSSSIKKSI
ncbi:MAG: NAD-dependent epimerase/dehydratase family protein [Oscillospiraceae bacterium]